MFKALLVALPLLAAPAFAAEATATRTTPVIKTERPAAPIKGVIVSEEMNEI